MPQTHFLAMGCRMEVILDAPERLAKPVLDAVPGWFESWEQALSRFRPDSELSRLNAAGGQPFAASETLWQVLEAALQAEQETGAIVTPAVLPAVERAGYTRSFDLLDRAEAAIGDAGPEAEPKAILPIHAIVLDPVNRTVRLPEGMRLDFGGVAKGWAAHQAAQRLAETGPALVDAGGDIAISRERAGDDGAIEAWRVGVADPLNPQQDLAVLALYRGGIATSGRDRRKWVQGGKVRHHLIDPRTGEPAVTDILSATVVAPDVMQAEAAAKTALILGSRDGLEWIEQREELAALLALEDGQVLRSSNLWGILEKEYGFDEWAA